MNASVVFEPEVFRDLYPQFTPEALSDGQLRQAFGVACLLLDNTASSQVTDLGEREALLYLLVCHLATLALWAAAGQQGPVRAATQGSVSVTFAPPQRANGTWFDQTLCGQSFWAAMAKYRGGGRYYPVQHHHPWG